MFNSNARDMEELEGALLPVATEVVNDSNATTTATTTPTATVIPSAETVFNYETALQNEDLQEEAFVLPDNANHLNYAGVSDDSKSTVGRAQLSGKIRSEEEIQSIKMANRKVFAQNYFERNSVKTANERAKQRDREGLQIHNDHIDEQMALSQKAKKEEAAKEATKHEQDQQTKGYQTKGYQITDYDCGTYETSTYEITEYKSVYD